MNITSKKYGHNWERCLRFEEQLADLKLFSIDKNFAQELGIEGKEFQGKTIYEVDIGDMTNKQINFIVDAVRKETSRHF